MIMLYFFYLYVSIFQNYNKYLFNTEEETKKICKEIIESKNYDEIPIEHLCKTSAFLKEFKKGDEQFEISDNRSLNKMYEDIVDEGLQPVLNDYLYM